VKLRNVVMGAVAITLLSLFGCQAGGGDPTAVAEQFMDRYYNRADLGEAKTLAIPALAEKIDETFRSSAGATSGNIGGTREIAYTLKETNRNGTHSYAIYEATITSKAAGSVRKRVHLSVDLIDGAWKIAEFKESAFQ